jgi:hypothetical protein
MLNFFRKVRQNLLSEGKTGKYLKYAIGEILLVVIGILIALQVNNWNENRKNRMQEKFILERLNADLTSDVSLISYQIDKASTFLDQYMFCVDVILDERQSTRKEFIKNLSPLLTILYFDQNRTTFDNIVSSGQIEFLQNQALTDSIIKYYNDGSNIGWDSGLLEYTRNIFAPYMMQFDHTPQVPQTSYRAKASVKFTEIDVSKSVIKPKSLEDYKNDVFILNMLRNKIYLMEGQLMEYESLKDIMGKLQKQIKDELNKS